MVSPAAPPQPQPQPQREPEPKSASAAAEDDDSDAVHLFPDDVIATIAGNAPRAVKEVPLKWLSLFRRRAVSFAKAIAHRIEVVEVSVVGNPDDPRKVEGRVVCELEVAEDMLNESGYLHEGCAVFLIDECSVCSLATLNVTEKRDFEIGVSQAINTTFHHPAKLGTKLRIVNTSMSTGERMGSCRSEIWDVGNHRLVASGVQLQMVPSRPLSRV